MKKIGVLFFISFIFCIATVLADCNLSNHFIDEGTGECVCDFGRGYVSFGANCVPLASDSGMDGSPGINSCGFINSTARAYSFYLMRDIQVENDPFFQENNACLIMMKEYGSLELYDKDVYSNGSSIDGVGVVVGNNDVKINGRGKISGFDGAGIYIRYMENGTVSSLDLTNNNIGVYVWQENARMDTLTMDHIYNANNSYDIVSEAIGTIDIDYFNSSKLGRSQKILKSGWFLGLPPMNWTAANKSCVDLGMRLPTYMEVVDALLLQFEQGEDLGFVDGMEIYNNSASYWTSSDYEVAGSTYYNDVGWIGDSGMPGYGSISYGSDEGVSDVDDLYLSELTQHHSVSCLSDAEMLMSNPEIIEIDGLFWQKEDSSVSFSAYSDANSYCEDLNLLGNDEWRLPKENEISSVCSSEDFDGCEYAYWGFGIEDYAYFTEFAEQNVWFDLPGHGEVAWARCVSSSVDISNIPVHNGSVYFANSNVKVDKATVSFPTNIYLSPNTKLTVYDSSDGNDDADIMTLKFGTKNGNYLLIDAARSISLLDAITIAYDSYSKELSFDVDVGIYPELNVPYTISSYSVNVYSEKSRPILESALVQIFGSETFYDLLGLNTPFVLDVIGFELCEIDADCSLNKICIDNLCEVNN